MKKKREKLIENGKEEEEKRWIKGHHLILTLKMGTKSMEKHNKICIQIYRKAFVKSENCLVSHQKVKKERNYYYYSYG